MLVFKKMFVSVCRASVLSKKKEHVFCHESTRFDIQKKTNTNDFVAGV